MELLNVEEQARKRFNNVYNCIDTILRKRDCFDNISLQHIYNRLAKKEMRDKMLENMPGIGKIYANERVHTYFTSDAILRLAQFMNRCGIIEINYANVQELKDRKEEIYNNLFREDYENEVRVDNFKIDAKNCLFPPEDENYE